MIVPAFVHVGAQDVPLEEYVLLLLLFFFLLSL
jgi:hypothetical protein